ncbi:MAG TPA: alpha/beta fold hydrolase [Mesotoga sp.]|nr:alpha/beta fold hydrolase [Mesotoga sp.]
MIFVMIVLSVFAFLLLAGFVFSSKVIKPNCVPYEETYRMEIDKGRFDPVWYDKLKKEEHWIDSPYGYKLHAIYLPCDASKKTVIICHGITYSLFGSMKYARIFLDLGFNVMTYDHRNHGKSGGKDTTFGHYEKYDLKAVKEWVLKRTGEGTIVGLHGESMGAAIALQYLAMDENISFCIADCGFSDLKELFKIRVNNDFHLPAFPFMDIAALITRIRTGMSFADISPVKAVGTVKTPVMFVHGSEDWYVPAFMSRKMYEAKKTGSRKLLVVPGAAHASSIATDPAGYTDEIRSFLEQYGLS